MSARRRMSPSPLRGKPGRRDLALLTARSASATHQWQARLHRSRMTHMTSSALGRSWTSEELRYLEASRELEIAARRVDGDLRGWTPIWVVVVEDEVFVRTWHRRTTGWYGRAVASARASIRVAGQSVDVVVEVTGDADADAVDGAYRTKYGVSAAHSMVTAEASASTLRLTRASKGIV